MTDNTENTAENTTESSTAGKTEQSRTTPPLMPMPTFSTFILSLASSALVQLGEAPDPASGKMEEDITMAKHTIDILSMLQEKTQRCLDEDEKRLINGLLYELRMKYVVKR